MLGEKHWTLPLSSCFCYAISHLQFETDTSHSLATNWGAWSLPETVSIVKNKNAETCCTKLLAVVLTHYDELQKKSKTHTKIYLMLILLWGKDAKVRCR